MAQNNQPAIVPQGQQQDKCRQYLKDIPKNENFKLRPRQDLCIHRFDEYSTTNGVLLLHNVGSGKTITSLTLAINGLDWDNGGPETRIILLVHPTGLMDEFMTEIEEKILNIERVAYGEGNGRVNNDCITDEVTGIRRYKYKKITTNARNVGPRNAPTGFKLFPMVASPQFYIESIQFNELARYFARYDESIARIRTIFRGKIVIIDEAHRLFRQFDVCDKSSMLITKYVNDNLLGGAKKIIAMTGTPLKNGITDMLTMLKLINIPNLTERFPNQALFTIQDFRNFDMTNKETFRNLRKTTKKTIDPRFWSTVHVSFLRACMAFYDYRTASRTDLSEQYPSFTDKYIRNCAKVNDSAEKKGMVVATWQSIKLMFSDLFNLNKGKSINPFWSDENARIEQNFGLLQQGNAGQPGRGGGGRKHNKTKKMRGGINIKNEEEARNLLEIPADVTKSDLKNKAKLQFRKLSRLYHPDRNVGSSEGLQSIMKDKFQHINAAFTFILKDESGEEKEEQKITYYYSGVVENVLFTTFMNWSDDELINFRKNMEYILLNEDFKYFSTYDLLVEFAAYNPFDYMDLLTENLEDIKNVTLSEVADITKNYENEKIEDYELYFKTDYEMFNNLYVEKEPIKFIQNVEDISGSSTPNGEDTGSPTERGRSAAEGGPGDVQDSSTPNVPRSSTPNVPSSSTPNVPSSSTQNVLRSSTQNVPNSSKQTDDDLEAEMLEANAWGGADIKGSNKDEYSNDYVNLIYGNSPNEIELSALFNKIKNAKNNDDELNKLLGDIPPEMSQNIKDKSKKIQQIETEIQPTIKNLISTFDLLIENGKKEPNMIKQSGGNGMATALLAIVTSLKALGVGFTDLASSIYSGLSAAALANYLTIVVDYIYSLPETIGALIPTESITGLLDTWRILGYLSTLLTYVIDASKGTWQFARPTVIWLIDAAVNFISPAKNFIFCGIVGLLVAERGYTWYYYNTSISSLNKKSWFRNQITTMREYLRQWSKYFSVFKSKPEGLAEMNIAQKNNWTRKVNRLKIDLYRTNAFFEFDYDKFVAMAKPLVSTITVLMPQLNDDIYRKIVDTNLYTVEEVYTQGKLFRDREYRGYPTRECMPILCCYNAYQYYAFNQFQKILKELENSSYIDYINNYIPWYLNKKALLEIKLLGNLSIDTSYPLASFKDNTRSIVYFDLDQQKYVLNVDQEKINAYNLNPTVGSPPGQRGAYRIYKAVDQIDFSCPKFEKILNYLILMKTGYMVNLTDDKKWTSIPQPHLLEHAVTIANFSGDNINPELINSVHTITPATTQYFLPFVYSISDEMGLNLFAYFLKKRKFNFRILHESTANESEEKLQTIKRSYPIINVEGDSEVAKANKKKLTTFFVNNIVHSLNDTDFETTFEAQLKGDNADPICVLLHPFKTEGIDAKYNPAIFLLEPALNFGDYEQLCGRVLRTYEGAANYQIKPKKMIYQCLTSSRVALNKFTDNYTHLKKDEVPEEDYFSVENLFDVKDVTVKNPYNDFDLRNSFLSYYCPNLINYGLSNLADSNVLVRGAIGAVIGGVVGIGAVALGLPAAVGVGVAAAGSFGVAVATQTNPFRQRNEAAAIGVGVVINNALVSNTILDYAMYASLEDSIFNHKMRLEDDRTAITNVAIDKITKDINNLDAAMNDLVQGIAIDKDQDITNINNKSNYDFYALLNEFIIKARYALNIYDESTLKWLKISLGNAFGGQQNDYYEKIALGTYNISEKFGVFMDLDYKVNKYEYAKLILRDIIKYADAFIIPPQVGDQDTQTYNVSFLLELIKFLRIIPKPDDFDINTVDIGSEIKDFLSIKRTEFMFNKILTKRLESKAPIQNTNVIPDDKIIPDLEAIIESVNAIPDEATRNKIKFMPWCNTVSKDKYNRCNTTNKYFRGIPDIYNLDNVDEIRGISDRIIAGIEGDVTNDKTALDNYYRRMYRPYPNLPFVPNNPGDNDPGDNDQDANAVVANANAQGAIVNVNANAQLPNANAQGAIVNANVDALGANDDDGPPIDPIDIDGGTMRKMITKSKKRTIKKNLKNKVNVSKTRNNRKK